jgi:hypothetical protein
MCNSASIELCAGHRLLSIHHYFHTATVWELFPGKWITPVRYLNVAVNFTQSTEFVVVYSLDAAESGALNMQLLHCTP